MIRRLRAVQSPRANASLIVVKFFKLFDILLPEIDKCPMCKK
jgi:hypothetical protein